MPKAAKPRKKYTPRGVNPPVTQGLIDKLARELRFSIMAMEHGGCSATNWKEAGTIIFMVSMASDENPRVDKADKVAVDSAVLVLKAVSDRQVRTGSWQANELDLLGLIRGANAAERILKILKHNEIALGYRAFVQLTRTIKD